MILKLSFAILPLIFLGLIGHIAPNIIQGITVNQETGQPANIGSGYSMSHNWAGYIASDGTFTSVKGSWTIPQVSSTSTSADATWIGIGGIRSKDLIQTGTQAMVANGRVSYQAWYELLPAGSRRTPLTVSPGDSITASILQQSGNQWTISLDDTTTGQHYETSVTYTSSLSSAEWIEEMPVQGRSFIPLDNFGSVQFSGLSTVKNGVELTPTQANAVSMEMANNLGQVVAQPSAMGSDGASFSVTRTTASVSTQSVSPYVRISRRITGVHQPYYRQGIGRLGSGFWQRFED